MPSGFMSLVRNLFGRKEVGTESAAAQHRDARRIMHGRRVRRRHGAKTLRPHRCGAAQAAAQNQNLRRIAGDGRCLRHLLRGRQGGKSRCGRWIG